MNCPIRGSSRSELTVNLGHFMPLFGTISFPTDSRSSSRKRDEDRGDHAESDEETSKDGISKGKEDYG